MLAKLFDLLLWTHILSGVIGVLIFWVVMRTIKGGPNHLRFGGIFVWLMVLTCLTSFLMALVSIYDPKIYHADKDVRYLYSQLTFLSFLGVISLCSVVNGKRSIQFRSRLSELNSDKLILGLNGAGVILAFVVIGLGFWFENFLLIFFSALGYFVCGDSIQQVRSWKTGKGFRAARTWLDFHIESMVAGGIALHTALLAGGGQKFLPPMAPSLRTLLWVLPTAIGIWGIRKLRRSYRSVS